MARIGRLYFTWMSPADKELITTTVRNSLYRDAETRAIIARCSRSEVKNYMAELAEQAEVPFGDPAAFVRDLKRSMPQ